MTTRKPLTVWITTNWKIIKEVGTPDYLTCLLRNLYADQESTESDMKQWPGSKLGKEYVKAYILSPCLFNFYAEYIMRNAGLEEAQAGIKIAGRNITNLRYADAAKSLQSCPTLCNPVQPHTRQPTRLPHPWDSSGKNTGVGCHFLLQRMKVKSESEVAQSCPTLRDPMDCSPPGSSVHRIFQARVLAWGAIAFSACSTSSQD